jgi:hypothetical protein
MKFHPARAIAGACAEDGSSWRWLAPALLLLLALAVIVVATGDRSAYAHHLCPNTGSPRGPYNFRTLEAQRSTYGKAFELAGRNKLLPGVPGFALPAMETGPRSAGSSQMRGGYIPPVLIKAIAWIEAGWSQADYSVAYGSYGPALISHDCGYGLMQVTTGMQNASGLPTVNQSMIGGHFAYNIARGAQILIDKWNHAPEYRPIVGARDPAVLENWYYAVWSYNGFSYKNHPYNSQYPANRLPYSCGPSSDGLGHNRTHYPYQELVFGCIANPPVIDGVRLWTPQAITMPNRAGATMKSKMSSANWDACAYNIQCGPMDFGTPQPSHRDGSPLTATQGQVLGAPSLSVSSANISMIAVPPSFPAASALAVANVGSGVLSYRITSNSSWLKVSRYQDVALGANLGGRRSVLQITANTTGLGPGKHTAQLLIESVLTAHAPKTINVTVNNFPDGTLLKGTGTGVYIMKGGLRRGIPNPFTMGVNGYDPARVIEIPDSVLRSLPAGNRIIDARATGMLYRSGTGIWVLDGGRRRLVTSKAVFDGCGYGTDALKSVSHSLLVTLTAGSKLSSGPCPRFVPPEGSLVKGSGGTVYMMRSSLRRGLPNGATFNGMGLKWGNVDRLPDSQIRGIVAGNSLLNVLTTGMLVKGTSATVYVMDNGQKRGVPSPATMTTCGYAWEGITVLLDADVGAIPSGAAVPSGGPCPLFTPPTGSMLRGSGGTIYAISHGLRRSFPNAATLEGRGYQWGNIDVVHDSYLSAVPVGEGILNLLDTGHLLKGSGGTIWVMSNGQKRGIPNAATMSACGYRWDAVYTLSDNRLNAIGSGSPVAAPSCPRFAPEDGTLLQGDSTAVYAAESGARRGITGPSVITTCNYQWGNINRVKPGMIASLPAGAPLSEPPCP